MCVFTLSLCLGFIFLIRAVPCSQLHNAIVAWRDSVRAELAVRLVLLAYTVQPITKATHAQRYGSQKWLQPTVTMRRAAAHSKNLMTLNPCVPLSTFTDCTSCTHEVFVSPPLPLPLPLTFSLSLAHSHSFLVGARVCVCVCECVCVCASVPVCQCASVWRGADVSKPWLTYRPSYMYIRPV